MPRQILQTFEAEFQKTKSQIDRSLAQLSDEELQPKHPIPLEFPKEEGGDCP